MSPPRALHESGPVTGERTEFERGPNENYLHSLSLIIEVTGNERRAPVIEGQLESGDGSLGEN